MSLRPSRALCRMLALVWLAPVSAGAQTAVPPQQSDATSAPAVSRTWVAIGGAPVPLRGDCTFCELEGREARYNHTWGLVVDAGVAVTSQMDVGAEVMWVPGTSVDGDAFRVTVLAGVAQFRPWASAGFFVKGGVGMAFVRNWVFDIDSPIIQKALAVHIGTGWAFRRDERVGFEIFGAQHAVSLGDFETRQG